MRLRYAPGVKNAVGKGGIADMLMPVVGGHCEVRIIDRLLITVVADLQKIATLRSFIGAIAKVVKNSTIDPRQLQQHPSDAAIGMRYRQIAEQLTVRLCAP